ncbi:MAG: cytochrome D ubiquinol oxidase subunit I [Chloroflexi bacterium RBG_16_48_8]|nr:MAG: cytochrome D ubiquinol oxidase subunit I [Chloroflexi bacterium RBG_16_48_8]
MDPVILSRWQFAITTVYHFFFVPLTLGLGWFVAIMETIYVRTGNEAYKRVAKFWGKLFLINFAMGVVTGIVLEFQFGMNWSEFSRYVGDIFGAPLAIEALLAFFLESTFLGIWIFGWDRLSKGLHALTIWMVVIGSNLSALWILIANAWMQHPVGYVINEFSGRAELVDFAALIFNPKAWLFFWHTISAGFATAAFFVLGISAYHLVREKGSEVFRRSFHMAAVIGIVAAIMVGVAGHFQGLYLLEVQPMAAVASEAHYDTSDPAPFSLVAIFDSTGKREIWSLQIPKMLSMLYYLKPEGEIPGINQIQAEYVAKFGPGDYVPLVALAYWTFRIMVGIGLLMIALGIFALFMIMKNWPEKWARWLKWLVWVIPLPYIANTAGWILTETGRQPWIVHGLLKTENAMSTNLSAGTVLFTLIGFTLIYAVLMMVDIYLLSKYAKAGMETAAYEPTNPVSPMD